MRLSFVGLAYWRLAAQIAGAMLIVAAILSAAGDARGQSVARGQGLYSQLGCSASNCHGPNPGANLNELLNGANSASAIEYAATTRSDMQYLRTSFDLDPALAEDLAAWLATVRPDPPAPPASAVTNVFEYYHAEFGHYFTTGIAAEIAALDSGQLAGWTRTGRSFNAYVAGSDAVVPVCRFFTVAFAPKSSHFYTPVAAECDGLRGAQGAWQFEGEAFWVQPADASGGCAAGTAAVYRLYNSGQGGAPNHRYTIDPAVRAEMLGTGWVAEGLGPLGVIFCAPL